MGSDAISRVDGARIELNCRTPRWALFGHVEEIPTPTHWNWSQNILSRNRETVIETPIWKRKAWEAHWREWSRTNFTLLGSSYLSVCASRGVNPWLVHPASLVLLSERNSYVRGPCWPLALPFGNSYLLHSLSTLRWMLESMHFLKTASSLHNFIFPCYADGKFGNMSLKTSNLQIYLLTMYWKLQSPHPKFFCVWFVCFCCCFVV